MGMVLIIHCKQRPATHIYISHRLIIIHLMCHAAAAAAVTAPTPTTPTCINNHYY